MQAYLYGVRRIDMKDDNGGQINGYSCFIGYPADGVIGDEVSKVFVSDSMVKKCTWSPEVGKLVNVEFTPKGNAFMAYLAADSSFVPESDYVSTLPASVISSDGEQIFPFIHEITRADWYGSPGADCGHSFLNSPDDDPDANYIQRIFLLLVMIGSSWKLFRQSRMKMVTSWNMLIRFMSVPDVKSSTRIMKIPVLLLLMKI